MINMINMIFMMQLLKNVVCCPIQYHVHNLKNVKNTHGGVLLLEKLQAETSNFTKSNTPPWVFFAYFKLHEWYQIAQSTTNSVKNWDDRSSSFLENNIC